MGRKRRRPSDPPADHRAKSNRGDLRKRLMQRNGCSACPTATTNYVRKDRYRITRSDGAGAAVAAVASKRKTKGFGRINQRWPSDHHRSKRRRHNAGQRARTNSDHRRHGRRGYPVTRRVWGHSPTSARTAAPEQLRLHRQSHFEQRSRLVRPQRELARCLVEQHA